ncbi:MBL fold metallo-hydrolase, partial [Streptomyces sp. MCAF7]
MKSESVQSIVLGDVEVIRVTEWQGPFAPTRGLVPEAAAEVWKDNE